MFVFHHFRNIGISWLVTSWPVALNFIKTASFREPETLQLSNLVVKLGRI